MAACLDGRRVTMHEAPDPLLLQEQVEASLEAARVPMVRCDGEADVDLARACARKSSVAKVVNSTSYRETLHIKHSTQFKYPRVLLLLIVLTTRNTAATDAIECYYYHSLPAMTNIDASMMLVYWHAVLICDYS